MTAVSRKPVAWRWFTPVLIVVLVLEGGFLWAFVGGSGPAVVTAGESPFSWAGRSAPLSSGGARPEGEAAVSALADSSNIPSVNSTLVVFNDTLVPGNFAAENGLGPDGLAYDPAKGEIFVANPAWNFVSVVSDSQHVVLTTVTVGTNPETPCYDSGKGEVFVPNLVSDTVSVINDTNDTVVATIPVGSFPESATYDPAQGELFVTNAQSNNVSVINDTNNTVVGTLPVGAYPVAASFDPELGELFVANDDSGNVSVVNTTTNLTVSSVPVGSYPVSTEFDPTTAQVFVVNSGSDNVSVISTTTDRVTATVAVGDYPLGAVYDPADRDLFVANSDSNNVSAISDTNDTVVTSVPAPDDPVSLTLDSHAGEVYVAEHSSDTLAVISATSDQVVSTVITGDNPDAVAYDAGRGTLFVGAGGPDTDFAFSDSNFATVANWTFASNGTSVALAYDSGRGEVFVALAHGPNAVEVIDDSTDQAVASIPVGSDPVALTYDPVRGLVFVANRDSNTVSVINDTTHQLTTVPVGADPSGIACDPLTGDVYVTNLDNLSVIDEATEKVVHWIPVTGGPTGVVYAADLNEMLVAEGSGNVTVINATSGEVTGTIAVGGEPFAVAYDPDDRTVLVTNDGTNDLDAINASTGQVTATVHLDSIPAGVTYDAGTNEVFVATWGGTVSVLRFHSTYSVTFSETGLPAGTLWSVTLDGATLNTTSSQVSFEEPNGSYRYAVGSVAGWAASSYSGSVGVQGSDRDVLVTWIQRTYLVTFTESGLPTGTPWWVNVSGGPSVSSNGTSLAFDEPNGSFAYSVATTNKTFEAVGGTLLVEGVPVNEAVSFTKVTYLVTFTETGLPVGTEWSVTLANTSEEASIASISFPEANGTYTYRIGPLDGWTTNYSGSVVVDGTGQVVPTVWTQVTYDVTFTESGLPNGTVWWVNLTGGQSFRGSTSRIAFPEPNGTYPFLLAAANRSFAAPGGNLSVNGTPVAESAGFRLVVYTVSLSESGLPTGTRWWVNVSGQAPATSLGPNIMLALPNGSYAGAVATGNTSYSASGVRFTVSGTSIHVAVPFSLVTFRVVFTETGLPSGSEWWVNLTGGRSFTGTGATITFFEPNGSYAYTLATANKTFAASRGVFSVNGAPAAGSADFLPVTYDVTFVVGGLPTGTSWSVTLSGVTNSSAGSELSFQESNGTHAFSVGAVSGYAASPARGALVVNGTNVEERLTFTATTVSAPTFLGLPSPEGYALLGVGVGLVAIVGTYFAVRWHRRHRRVAEQP